MTYVILAAYLSVVLGAWFGRSKAFGVFAIVVLAFPVAASLALRDAVGPLEGLWLYLPLASCLHIAMLVLRPAMRPWWFRATLSLPSMWFVASSFFAIPWAVLAFIGAPPWGWWLPYLLGVFGLWQSLVGKEEEIDLVLDGVAVPRLARHPTRGVREPVLVERPLRVIQITDPHLGPFMSVRRLRRICERTVERAPDLVLITGDMMTMESHDAGVVAEALAPLRALEGKVFACHGNHDLEARSVIAEAFERTGIRLLVDDAVVVSTSAGTVQIVGCDFVWRKRAEHLAAVCARHPRVEGALRLLLLHDPGAFRHLPEGEADLVLSGHTHGGQVGFLSLGSPTTFLTMFSDMPDHGLWARGTDRLYVHRAQGHYGFPIRLGVPSEQSLMKIHAGSTRRSAHASEQGV